MQNLNFKKRKKPKKIREHAQKKQKIYHINFQASSSGYKYYNRKSVIIYF